MKILIKHSTNSFAWSNRFIGKILTAEEIEGEDARFVVNFADNGLDMPNNLISGHVYPEDAIIMEEDN